MTRLSFALNLGNVLNRSLDVPVEVRKPNMALVQRTLASESIDIEPGRYFVSAALPSGEKLFTQVDVVEGRSFEVVLESEQEPVEEPVWSFHDRTDEQYALGYNNTYLHFYNFANVGEPEVKLARYSGNFFTGVHSSAEDPKLSWTELEGAPLLIEGGQTNQLIQLQQPNDPAFNMLLPAQSGESCEIHIKYSPETGLFPEVRLTHPEADLLLQYLDAGYLREASVLVNSKSLDFALLFSEPKIKTQAAVIKAYTLLRLGQLDSLADWSQTLFESVNGLADSLIIHGEYLARLGRHREALALLTNLASRGIPCFSDGLSYAVDRLRLYTKYGGDSFTVTETYLAKTALARLEEFVSFADLERSILTYTGLDPSHPDAELIHFLETAPPVTEIHQPAPEVFDEPVSSSRQPPFLAIDFGTTNSVVATMLGNEPTIIGNLPSVVAFTSSGERLIGQPAKRQAVMNPQRTVHSIKRFLGRRYSEVKSELAQVLYKIGPGANDAVRIDIDGKLYSPEEISSFILRRLAEDATSYLGHEVKDVVITVPAFFDAAQRQAIKDAGHIAGLNVIRIINEPTAASLAYGLNLAKYEKILVFNLGGGAFDVSVVVVGNGVFEVIGTHGDTHFGGNDFDERIANWIIESFAKEEGIELRNDRLALQRIREAAEKAKIELSSLVETEINLPFITADINGPKHLLIKLTRDKFEELTRDLVERCIGPVKQLLGDVNVSADDLAQTILVGGSTRIPAIRNLVKRLIGGIEPNHSLNPDQVVAIGAAIQAGVLTGDVKDVLLLDVTPLSLGLETLGGVMTKLINRNSTIPCRKSEIFSTAEDNQTSVEVTVLQGERELAKDNRTLGKLHLTGIAPAPRGMPQLEVTFDIDANGLLTVSARDAASGKEQKLTITGSTSLDKDDIERMLRDAEQHSNDDKARLEFVNARNTADSISYQLERQLRELGDRWQADDRESARMLINETRMALQDESTTTERLRQLTGELQQSSNSLMIAAYNVEGDVATAAGTSSEAAQSGAGEYEVDEKADYNS